MLSREEINKKLDKLRKSRIEDGSYKSVKPVNAMCYSMMFPTSITIQKDCYHCHKTFDIETTDIDNDFDEYEEIVKKFLKVGVEAELRYLCPDCIKEKGHELELMIKIDSNEIISYPYVGHFGINIDTKKTSNLLDYELVIMFLSKNHTYKSFLKDDNFSMDFRDRQVDKFMIDRALNMILGLDIEYDKKEAMKQFECFVNKYSGLKKEIKKYNKKFNEKLNQIDGDVLKIEQFAELLESIFNF